ncbi:HD domain-containing protein [Streptococcus hongkongensis]
MDNAVILQEAREWVKAKLDGESSGHDWWHIVRVTNTAKTIAEVEHADIFICQLAALLHDMADEKLNPDPKSARQDIITWLEAHAVDTRTRQKILYIIDNMSFKGGHGIPLETIEGRVVQDADRLDAIGAIGIARCMAYSGYKGRLIHDPNMQPRQDLSPEEYRNGQDTAIMHFYEKLLKLKELMNTSYGRKMAEQRHQFLLDYLEQFYAEWDGLR